MKIFVGQGYYDLATPHLATQYMITHMNIDPELRDNVSMVLYPAGHMFYLDIECLAQHQDDVARFVNAALD